MFINTCPHQPLIGMTGPDIELHIDPSAKPKSIQHTSNGPSSLARGGRRTDQKRCSTRCSRESPLLRALSLVPQNGDNQKSGWISKKNIRPLNKTSLNKHCLREIHYIKPPSQYAKAIPANTWKTVTNVWNGYHSVPIRKEDRDLTAFITL